MTRRKARRTRPRPPGAAPPTTRPPVSGGGTNGALLLPVACAIPLVWVGLLIPLPGLSRAFLAAGATLLVWTAALYAAVRRRRRPLVLQVALRPQHWVQACAQTAVLLYWGWYVPFVYAFIPLIVAQLVFAYGVESLVTWSRRDRFALGFGPFPVILSINLFLWLKPDWFVLQFAMIPLGYLAKELIHWERAGRPTHIFNPSSFPLAVISLVLIANHASGITLGTAIASSQFYPPYIYAVIFLAALPGQLLFGVATMTASAVVSLYAISAAYVAFNGTYLFYDTHIPIAVFLGMHLLFTDPTTSPRSTPGRVLFGVLYALGTAGAYSLLGAIGTPTFYDKLLPVPFMNLLVRRIDRLAAWRRPALMAPSHPRARLSALRLNLAPTAVWAVLFLALSALRGVGDNPAGQSLPFWERACGAGLERACRYEAQMMLNYCNEGSGWACNERGVQLAKAGRRAAPSFQRACQLGFAPGCANASPAAGATASPTRGAPLPADLPIVLRGTKPPLRGWPETALQARACAQGWPGACGTAAGASGASAPTKGNT